jgi:3-(3-hydroxy-phenyl)propionate hydroxylase
MDTTRFVCDWRRPAFVSPATHGSYRLEFMLRPGETATDMERPEMIAALVEPYVDPARFDVTRAVVYTFHHLIAKDWQAGRVFLLGDAAHQMPPFMGQGLCSGLRDAANLTWKLGLVLAGHATPTLLRTYEAERRPHTEEMATVTVQVGRIFLARRRGVAWLRDTALRSIQLIPRVRRFFRHFEFKPLPVHKAGMTASGKATGAEGRMFPQPRVVAADSSAPQPLDGVLGAGFTVIGPGVRATMADDRRWLGLPVTFVGVRPQGTKVVTHEGGYLDVVDVDGVLADWYGKYGVDVVVLRPDRFVFGAATGDAASTLPGALANALRQAPVGDEARTVAA